MLMAFNANPAMPSNAITPNGKINLGFMQPRKPNVAGV